MRTRRAALRTFAAGLTVSLVPLPGTLRAQESRIVKQGRFTGENTHSASGTVAIVEHNGRFHISIGGDFVVDGAPDLKIALRADGFDGVKIIGPLEGTVGAQSCALPAALDPAPCNEVWIWSGRLNLPLGRATLA